MKKSTKKTGSSATASRARSSMKISRRVVNTKRHTQGYIVNGKYHNISATTKLARQERIAGVRVVGNHIQAVNGRKRLSELPVEIRRARSSSSNRSRSQARPARPARSSARSR